MNSRGKMSVDPIFYKILSYEGRLLVYTVFTLGFVSYAVEFYFFFEFFPKTFLACILGKKASFVRKKSLASVVVSLKVNFREFFGSKMAVFGVFLPGVLVFHRVGAFFLSRSHFLGCFRFSVSFYVFLGFWAP